MKDIFRLSVYIVNLLTVSLLFFSCQAERDYSFRRKNFTTRALSEEEVAYSKYIPFPVKEELPLFPCACLKEHISYTARRKCSFKTLMKQVQRSICYPKLAQRKGIEGRVIIGFMIEENGQLSDFQIIRDIGGGCGEEALRVIKNLPQIWIPGRRQNIPMRMSYVLPVRFELYK
ncbi:MAG TPA: energy transducer TonB [Saprospiraceae bacterium]|nr:energy transducer TonB [Saprospiraceae bacterium]